MLPYHTRIEGVLSLPRPRSEYIRADVKVSLSAPLAAELNLALIDPLTQRRKYGALSKLVEALLRQWLADQAGEDPVSIPTLNELREN